MNSIKYGNGDMFIPKSILKLLLRGIAWYIDNPETYFQYALVHSITASAVREFSPYKKTQFTKWIKFGNIDYPILPNGWAHGFMSDNGHCVTYPINGLWNPLDRYIKRIKFIDKYFKYVKFTANLYISIYLYSVPMFNKARCRLNISTIKNKNKNKKIIISFYKCSFCIKYHNIILRFGNNHIRLAGECYQPLKFVKYHYKYMWFKPSLRSRVTSYARNLKKLK
jgi:hypothetical protein